MIPEPTSEVKVTWGKCSLLLLSSTDVVAVVVAEHAVDDRCGGWFGRPTAANDPLPTTPLALVFLYTSRTKWLPQALKKSENQINKNHHN